MSLSSIKPETAQDWFARVRSGELTLQETAQFQAWLDRDPDHLDQYERCERLWLLAEELSSDSDIQAIGEEALGGADPKSDTVDRIDRAHSQSPSSHGTRNRILGVLALAASLGLMALMLSQLLTTSLPDARQTYFTAVGERRVIELEDGSIIQLNTDSLVQANYSDSGRNIELLKGEALFSVQKDPVRPFKVVAGQGSATALGTRFNVRLLRDETKVSVLEGIVEVSVSDTQPAPHLRRGDQVSFDRDGRMGEVALADLERIRLWQQGKLRFSSAPLDKVIEEFNRYNTSKMKIRDQELKEVLISGVFNAGEHDALLFALEHSFGIRAHRFGNDIVLSVSYESSTE